MTKGKDVVGFGETLPEDMSFQELIDAGVISISEIDDRLKVDNKDDLIGVPLVIIDWEFKPSDMGKDYAFVTVKTQEGTRVFADGGTGIPDQLERYKAKLLDSGARFIYVPNGLRKSDYVAKVVVDGEEKRIPATTYYFDNAE